MPSKPISTEGIATIHSVVVWKAIPSEVTNELKGMKPVNTEATAKNIKGMVII